jgi:hypothetical protein
MIVNMDTSLGFLSLPSQCLNFRLFSLGFARLLTLKNSLVKAREPETQKSLNLLPEGYPLRKVLGSRAF